MMKKLKTTNHPDEEEHNIVRRRPMRAAQCVPPSGRFPRGLGMGRRGVAPRPPAQRHGRAADAAAVTVCPSPPSKPQQLLFRLHRPPQQADDLRRRRRCFCTAEGSDAKASLARPPAERVLLLFIVALGFT